MKVTAQAEEIAQLILHCIKMIQTKLNIAVAELDRTSQFLTQDVSLHENQVFSVLSITVKPYSNSIKISESVNSFLLCRISSISYPVNIWPIISKIIIKP